MGSRAANAILVIDPTADTAITIPSPISGTGTWSGGALGGDGRIYGIPRNSSEILVIDPDTDTATTFAAPAAGTDKWSGAVAGIDGRIYATPISAGGMLVIDPGAGARNCGSIVRSAYFNKF